MKKNQNLTTAGSKILIFLEFASLVSVLLGHYHYETDESALDADYEGYFNIAKSIWRVDNLPQAPNFDKIVDYPTVQSSAPGTPMPPALNGASKL